MYTSYLLAALEQAKLGKGYSSPNPAVGAVIVQDETILTQAYHHGAGTSHAEALALQALQGRDLSKAVLYVTLEPCNHWGRTPPCVDAIISSGIGKVVYAYTDPNPTVAANDTPSILKAHGIITEYQPLGVINTFYESYRHWHSYGIPFITAKLAQTLDAKIALADGSPHAISNNHCQQFTHQQRRYSDLILSTASTIRCDNPQLNVRIDGEEYSKEIAIIDRNLSLSLNEKVFHCAKKVLIFCAEGKKPTDTQKISYYSVPETSEGLCLKSIFKILGKLGYHDVWVEAGSRLFNTLHAQGLVNRTYLYIAPDLLGEGIPAFSQNCFADRPRTANWSAMGDNALLTLNWSSE